MLSLFVAAALAGCATPSEITSENYSKLEVGMTRAEVTAILGPPTGSVTARRFTPEERNIEVPSWGSRWVSRDLIIVIHFSEEDLLHHRWIISTDTGDPNPTKGMFPRLKTEL